MNVEDKGNEETERGAPVKAPRQKVMQSQMFQIVDMDALVPSDHILRQLRGAMDFSRVRDWVDPLYSSHTGRPAVEPEARGQAGDPLLFLQPLRTRTVQTSPHACGVPLVWRLDV